MAKSRSGVSVLIPSWNGKGLLEKYLLRNIALLEQELDAWEIIIADNGSQDGTEEWVRSVCADKPVRFLALDRNYGFGYALNQAIAAARYPYCYLLNNDLLLVKGSLGPLFAVFADPTVFAAFPWQKVIHAGKETVYAGHLVEFRRGMFRSGPQFGGDFGEQARPRGSWYASGAAALIDTEKLRQLEGFNLLYSPAYYEDTDLSHRAWQRGWKVFSVPTPPVEHWHESTSSRTPRWKMQAIQQRNLFLFQWCNLHDPAFWRLHLLWLLPNLARETIRTRSTLLGFGWALSRWPGVWRQRKRQVTVLSNRQMLAAQEVEA